MRGGASFAVAMQIAEKFAPGTVTLAMLPDTGARDLTTALFGGIPEDMDADKMALSLSRPGRGMG